MKKIVYTCLFCLLLVAANAQSKKKITKHITIPNEVRKITLYFSYGELEIKEISGSRMILDITAEISNSNEHLVDYLIKSGRYSPVFSVDNSTKNATLSLPERASENIVLRGEEIKETVKYVLYIPKHIIVIEKDKKIGIEQ